MREDFPNIPADTMGTKGEEKRQRILDAANALFYHKGFSATSFADIAADAGIPKGNFYFYFRSKDALLEAVVEERLNRLRALLVRWREELPDPKERLHRMADIPMQEKSDIARFGCPMGTLSAELSKPGTSVRNFTVSMFDLLMAEIRDCLTALGRPKGEAKRLARHLLLRLQGAASMAHAYSDDSWIDGEVKAVHDWIDAL